MNLTKIISDRLALKESQVTNVVRLIFDEGATIPFISRYRKEMTQGLDEVIIEKIKHEYTALCELQKRKTYVLETINQAQALTPELEQRIINLFDADALEDLFMPYKPKRRTRATIARELGLEPLAVAILRGERDIERKAQLFVKGEVNDYRQAIKGAMDIIAEKISEDERVRAVVRGEYERRAVIGAKVVKSKQAEAVKFQDYFDFEESLKRAPSHRLLAMIRGANEGFLRLSVSVENEQLLIERIAGFYSRSTAPYTTEAIEDGYKRLLKPSIETEILSKAKQRADTQSIDVFCANLRQLLLAAPLGQKPILAIDPGYRTGCKVVCLSANGELIHNETIYPHAPQHQEPLAIKKIASLVEAYKIEAIAIGNGTASRETEAVIQKIHFNRSIQVFVVSEDGASVYSASAIARQEFPEYDVTVRGSISIGRRLMDPLSELVKIDPKAIGVGQYQHDVDQSRLKSALTTVVESCVNSVGINLNTTSQHLLTYVSGIGPSMAAAIIEYRKANGDFRSRKELLNVPRLGAKAFQQCAGFLRINNGDNPLDASAVHPESYPVVERMANDLKVNISELIRNEALIATIDPSRYIDPQKNIGLPTLTDIITELRKPGLDPREKIKMFEFDQQVRSIDDLNEGMILPGIVNNITNFGVFVDVGIKQSGLVHISQLSDRFVSDVSAVVALHQHVTVKVVSVDKIRNRIQLSMAGVAQDR